MEIESLAKLDAVLDAGRSLRGLRLQDLDLAAREERLLRMDPAHAIVLGGRLTERLEKHLRHGGALIFPPVEHLPRALTGRIPLPVDPYRAGLYTPEELYAGLGTGDGHGGYEATLDAKAYRWWLDPATRSDVLATLLRAVHDDSIGDALDEAVAGRRCVGVMGGHAVERGTPAYTAAAGLGRTLAAEGLLVLTGGGPGAMEATNLGARLHEQPVGAHEAALACLAAVPSFTPDVGEWARAGLAVRAAHPAPRRTASIGIPTWFYGHEPPNVLACLVAKYFSNALREDVLLARATAGVVILPGVAGTVQEVFQTVTRLYYGLSGPLAPLVLVGRDHWTTDLPVLPLVEALGRDRDMAAQVHVVDDVDDVAGILAHLAG